MDNICNVRRIIIIIIILQQGNLSYYINSTLKGLIFHCSSQFYADRKLSQSKITKEESTFNNGESLCIFFLLLQRQKPKMAHLVKYLFHLFQYLCILRENIIVVSYLIWVWVCEEENNWMVSKPVAREAKCCDDSGFTGTHNYTLALQTVCDKRLRHFEHNSQWGDEVARRRPRALHVLCSMYMESFLYCTDCKQSRLCVLQHPRTETHTHTHCYWQHWS